MSAPTADVAFVIADVDGTLVDSDKRLTRRTLDVVAIMRSRDIGLMLVSGRPPRGLSAIVDKLHVEHPLIPFNGGMIVTPELEVIRETVLPDDVIAPITMGLIDLALDVWAYTNSEWLVTDAFAPHVKRETETVGFVPEVVPTVADRTDVIKLVGVSDDPGAIERAESSVRDRFGEVVSAHASQPYYLDITAIGADKGVAVDYAHTELGAKTSSLLAIGDMPSDLAMFEGVGLSVAMGNAHPDVKAKADVVTESNDDDGFAIAMERFVLH